MSLFITLQLQSWDDQIRDEVTEVCIRLTALGFDAGSSHGLITIGGGQASQERIEQARAILKSIAKAEAK